MDSGEQRIGGRYILHEQLGKGGMGAVYRATDLLTGKVVALKRVMTSASMLEFTDASLGSSAGGLRLALAQEFRTLASLRHPNIIAVLDYGFDETQQPYFTMDMLSGAAPFVAAGRRQQTIASRVDLLIQMLQALAYLHRRGILHRDLKPGNVLVQGDEVKVLDFGLAVKESQLEDIDEDSHRVGTLAYMAPETLIGEPAQIATDLYAVGVIAYELFAGQHPFDVRKMSRLIVEVINVPPDLTPVRKALTTLSGDTLKAADAGPKTSPGYDTMPLTLDLEDTDPADANTAAAPPADETGRAAEQDDPDEDATEQFGATETMRAIPQPDETDRRNTIRIIRHPGDDEDAAAEPPAGVVFSAPSRESLESIIQRLLAKAPQDRYHDADTVIEALAAAIGQPIPRESAAIRESFLQAADFVGREREMDRLETALLNAVQGTGSAWLIAGESGVGKSRLLDELRIRALVNGMVVLRGQAVEGDGVAYQLLREPLRRLALTTEINDTDAGILKELVPDIERLLGREVPDAIEIEGEDFQQRMAGTIVSLFQRQQTPLLLLLEDLQWAGEDLGIVQTISSIASNLPVLAVGSFRQEERPDLHKDLDNMQLMRLERLDYEGIAALTASMLGEQARQPRLLDLLQRETEGNVYFLVEVMRALAEEAGRLTNVGDETIPRQVFAGGVQTVIKRRLNKVPGDHVPLLELAAVQGRELDLEVLRRVRGSVDMEEWLTTCANVAVLEVQDGTWRFAHDKLRAAMLEQVAERGKRAASHRRIAEAIEAVYRDQDEQAATLAMHWRVAQRPDKELEASRRAGEYALRINVFQDAIRHLERALAVLEAVDLPAEEHRVTEADILIRLGEAKQFAEDYAAATEALEEALALVGNDPERRAQTLSLLADVAWYSGDYDTATHHAEESLSVAKEAGLPHGVGRALNRLGMIQQEQGDTAQATAYFDEALTMLEGIEDHSLRTNITNNLGVVAFGNGDGDRARHYFEQTLEMARTSGERRKAAIALINLGSVAGTQGDLESATRYLEETLETCREIGERRGMALALDNLGTVALDRERYFDAIGYFDQSLHIAREIGNKMGEASALTSLGDAARLMDDRDEALEYYTEAIERANAIAATPVLLDALAGLAQVTEDEARRVSWLRLVHTHSAASEYTRRLVGELLEGQPAGDSPPPNLDDVVALVIGGGA